MDALAPVAGRHPLARTTITQDPDARDLQTARRFETTMLTPLVEEMLRTSGEQSMGAGKSEGLWRSFMAGAVAEQITESGSTGIAAMVARQLAQYRT